MVTVAAAEASTGPPEPQVAQEVAEAAMVVMVTAAMVVEAAAMVATVPSCADRDHSSGIV